ncbi:hypothetical protein G6F63_016825 [Rhizopus arrhizus]|nr:hypothetical protein G6F63_016825 [Rhizopus arrhizus]
MAFGDERRQRGVRHQMPLAVKLCMRRLERRSQRFGQYQIPDAQARVQGLAEGAHVDDGRIRLQAQQRCDGPA